MIVHQCSVAGEQVTINVVETEEDLDGFRQFIRRNLRVLGLDSETTGLDIYSETFRCRLVQFGTPVESWVVPVELGGRFVEDVRLALRGVDRLILHNASYDLQVFEQTLGVPMEEMWPKVTDTYILAHLVDPRAKREGGIGHSLEELTRHYIDADIADGVKGLMNKLRLAHKTTKSKIWAIVPFDDPDYQRYSGMDPILAARLVRALAPLVPASSESLVPWEHQIAEVCSYIERKGFLLDVEYATQLSARLMGEEDAWKHIAAEMGCENVNATEQVADVLEARGVKIKGRTPTGKRQVNNVLLNELVKAGDDFAKAVVEAKKAGKWRKTWVQTFLDKADANNRCHAHINPLRARTARMSITGIPAQTLPAGDWLIRRCFLAEPGELMVSVDYQAQELRVLAALSEDETMIRAFENDLDLHQITADAADVERKIGKMANFLVVFGGGPGALKDQANISFPVAKKTVEAFDRTYPGVGQLSVKLQREAGGCGFVVTPSGRHLPVDASRGYASINFVVQSTARDVTCRALIRLHQAGFTPYIRLVIHDEILLSLPADKAEWGAAKIGQIMTEAMGPVVINTEAEVTGRSWGHGYMDEATKALHDA